MTPPRIVATDLDGTLLDSTGSVSPRTRAALRLAERAGAEIVFVTARPPRSTESVAALAGVTGTAVCSNGAIVYDLAGRTITERTDLDLAILRKIMAALVESVPGIVFAAETGHGVLCEPGYSRRIPEDLAFYRDVASLCDAGEPVAKLLAWADGHAVDDLAGLALVALQDQVTITHSGGRSLLEISATGVDKAATLARLCQARGVDPADVVAFGDMPNDLAVLAYAGHGYAMGNAHPLLLETIGRRTLSNDEDGVAAVLERLYGVPQR
ncbi:Cof-type HAD-IIB family hydrolase [Nonomuraea sp. NPDC050790]|uniref:Cof-type HAD-IIB family hydrolase n=1 Tax=Nonomuraea sp. NPDC050790 TaxID=3364371 RepID=UPI0037A3BF01